MSSIIGDHFINAKYVTIYLTIGQFQISFIGLFIV